MKKNTTKSYTKKLIILSYTPVVAILIFTFFYFLSAKKNLDDAKNLENNVYKYIEYFYELNYLQEERFWSIAYLNDKSKENYENLLNGYKINYENMNKIIPQNLHLLENIRNNKNLNVEKVSSIYSTIIDNYINTLFKINDSFNNKQFNSILNSYHVILKSNEKYYAQINNLFYLLSKNKINQKDLEKLIEIKSKISIVENELLPLLPSNIRVLFENVINDKNILKLKEISNNTYVTKKINFNNDELITLMIQLKEDLFILSNFIFNKIDNEAVNLYQSELNKVVSVFTFAIIIILFVIIFGVRLKNLITDNINENFDEIERKNFEIENLYKYVDKYVILSKTDLNGIINYASKAFCEISKYSKEELQGKAHKIIRHPLQDRETFKDMWETIINGKIWTGEIRNLAKDGTTYWTKSTVGPTYDQENNIIGYTSVRQDITLEKYAFYLNNQVRNLLDNANQGFLSFGKSFKIKNTYSKKSLEILSCENFEGILISDALFRNDINKKEIFELGIEQIMASSDEDTKNLLLTILPTLNTINEKTFSIDYKLIDDDKIMVILVDITEKLQLEEKIKHEGSIQKMIVAIATRRNDFIELKNVYIDFLGNISNKVNDNKNIQDNYLDIIKSLHTFKGLFAQEELINTTNSLHELETKLTVLKTKELLNNETLKSELLSSDLNESFQKDLTLIYEILGKDYLDNKNEIKVDSDKFRNFEVELTKFVTNNIKINDANILLENFSKIHQKSLKVLLEIYPERIKNMSIRLGKSINIVNIEGDPSITVSASYEQFIKNLVHVFRNMIDHGIELPDERELLGKPINGTIQCKFYISDENNIKLIISDDGKGMDIDTIKNRAIQRGIIDKEKASLLQEQEIYKLIFLENFSTKDNFDIISGRGIGLNSVLYELNKINGFVDIETKINEGTKFIFTLPLKLATVNRFDDVIEYNNIVLENLNDLIVNNIDININKTSKVEDFNLLDYYTTIKIKSDNYEIISILTIQKNLLNQFGKMYLDRLLCEDDDLSIYQSIIDETLNIVLGRTLFNSQNLLNNLEISTPLLIDEEMIKNLVNNNFFFNSEIETNKGILNIILIIKEL